MWTKKSIFLWMGVSADLVIGLGASLGIGLSHWIKNKNNYLIINTDWEDLSFWQDANSKNWYSSTYNNYLFYRCFPLLNKVGKYQILPNGNLRLIAFF